MRPRAAIGGVLALACWASPAAGSAAPDPGAALPRPEVTAARPFRPPALEERTLPNGLRVVAARRGTVPKFTVQLVVSGAGLAADGEGRVGLAAFTADAVLEGTATRTSEQIRREAFGMGGSLVAGSGQDFSAIEASGLSEYMPALLALVADVAMNPSFPEDELAALKTRQLQALLQQQASPQFLSNRAFREALFGEHPYARVAPREADLKALTRASVAAFHAGHYRPDRATLIVVGNVSAADVFEAAEKALGGWTRTGGRIPPLPPVAPPAERRLVFVDRPGSVQSSISFGNIAVRRSDPRWYALSLTNTLLGGSFNSRLTRKLREEKGYTYSPQSQFSAFADAGLYRFAADVRNEVTGAAIRDMEAEIARLQDEGANAGELADIKQYARGLFSIRMAASDLIADDLLTVYVFGLPKDYLERYQSRIGAVTPDEVKQAAGLLVTPGRSVLAIVGDWKAVKDQLAEYPDLTLVESGKAEK